LRETSPEVQEQAAQLIEALEGLLGEASHVLEDDSEQAD
jgi:hypothetical protein